MLRRFWQRMRAGNRPDRSQRKTEAELREAAVEPQAKRDRQPRNHEQAHRDPEADPAKPSDN